MMDSSSLQTGSTGRHSLLSGDVTDMIIGAAIEVHRELGPGLLESAYRVCLTHELSARSIPFRTEVALPVVYKGVSLEAQFRLDLDVADSVIVELKCVEKILPVHSAQLLTYMRLLGRRVGLLINFNVPLLRDGLVRKVL